MLSSSVIRVKVEEVLGGGSYQLAGEQDFADNFLKGFQVIGGGLVAHWARRARLLSVHGGDDFSKGDALEMFTGEVPPILALRILTSLPFHRSLIIEIWAWMAQRSILTVV